MELADYNSLREWIIAKGLVLNSGINQVNFSVIPAGHFITIFHDQESRLVAQKRILNLK